MVKVHAKLCKALAVCYARSQRCKGSFLTVLGINPVPRETNNVKPFHHACLIIREESTPPKPFKDKRL
ncbi:MAG: hypothetical protein N3D14_02585 [Aquificaceae bacterium]|nr:hypothetical protein [Aquificaceae bacterium]